MRRNGNDGGWREKKRRGEKERKKRKRKGFGAAVRLRRAAGPVWHTARGAESDTS